MVGSLASGVVEQEIEEAISVNQRFGISLFEVKVGYSDPAVYLERVTRLVRNDPTSFQIRLDAHQGWSEVTANWVLPRLRDIGITVLEQPLPSWDLAEMARLKQQAHLAIMVDEFRFTHGTRRAHRQDDAAAALCDFLIAHAGQTVSKFVGTLAAVHPMRVAIHKSGREPHTIRSSRAHCAYSASRSPAAPSHATCHRHSQR
jgi:L-alanine-DL-glutamate epimerase-like enolase superfamily enzyme